MSGQPRKTGKRSTADGSGNTVLGRALLIVALTVVALYGVGRVWSVPARAPTPRDAAPLPAASPAAPQPASPPQTQPTSPSPVPEAPATQPAVPPAPTGSSEPAAPASGSGDTTAVPTAEQHWGFVPNTQHKTPEIYAATQKLLDQHAAFWLGPTSQKTVYLTFDNGYEIGLTPDILKVLKKHQVKAMFFFTGANMKQNPDLLKQVLAGGHAVGNHTMNHLNLAQMTANTFESEVDGVDDLFFGLTGKHLRYFRCPEGTYSEAVLARLQARGYRTAFWSIAMRDWVPMPGGKDEALHGVVDHLHPGAVILLHSESKDDLAALDEIIAQTIAAGYSFGDPETL